MADPTLLTFTVMKNEGPFILEWVAWQRLIGVDTILVLTNDCDDGTDRILDELDRMDIVRHLPNPLVISSAESEMRHQPHMTGIAYAKRLRIWQDADYVFLSDVDEFPSLRAGDATLKALLKRLDWPDVLTMAETVFGTGDALEFIDKPVTQQFTRSASMTPGKWRSRRGFKSITRVDPRLVIRNHRPIAKESVASDLIWLDGSGNPFPTELRHVHQKGTDARGMFDLVTVNHYTLRSLESFLVKHARGDAVVEGRIDNKYFRRRNQVISANTEMLKNGARLEEEIAKLKLNARLSDLHDEAVAAHKAKIRKLKSLPLFKELRELAGFAPADG
ncbi:MAG: glycosyltransferase family 2 protein [Pseudomonadota bacterium]